jgi:hypothetical protein
MQCVTSCGCKLCKKAQYHCGGVRMIGPPTAMELPPAKLPGPPPHAPNSHPWEGSPKAAPRLPCGIEVGIPRLSPKFPSQLPLPVLGLGLSVPWKLGPLPNNPKRLNKDHPHPISSKMSAPPEATAPTHPPMAIGVSPSKPLGSVNATGLFIA